MNSYNKKIEILINNISSHILRQFPKEKFSENKVVELLDYNVSDHFTFGYISKFAEFGFFTFVKNKSINIDKEISENFYCNLFENIFYNDGREGLNIITAMNLRMLGYSFTKEKHKELKLLYNYNSLISKQLSRSFASGLYAGFFDYQNYYCNKKKDLPNTLGLHLNRKQPSQLEKFSKIVLCWIKRWGEEKYLKQISLQSNFDTSLQLCSSETYLNELIDPNKALTNNWLLSGISKFNYSTKILNDS